MKFTINLLHLKKNIVNKLIWILVLAKGTLVFASDPPPPPTEDPGFPIDSNILWFIIATLLLGYFSIKKRKIINSQK
jgi:hypothetical protein